ncbi:hypothetical protein CHLNCDRAFT_139746 [Chlorella variabilis]|uniref:S1 motif domain-containing protein n=1 Tax=Chlorella variabilis TaxID=554065 RepID=E1ZQV3_CHLVA|nr:hypothetical protein CHLNCDRAFT_139746 [Chlorella variabilis]EFN51854.1 hypothetical protein CHLNCDRAFT_139746 [Chlorella variabilis]|eukprot:XP_005843956.1 hypothetical protein CHLNCDRAFT_139746 [Chlorella variabilis]
MHGRVSAAAPGLMTQPAICRGHGNSRRRQQLGAVAAAAPLAQSAAAVQEGAEVVGTVVWAGPKGAKVLLPDDTIGFMPSREAPFVIRDALEDRATPAGREGPCLPKGLVRTFKHKENLKVTVEGANNGGLLSRLNGLSLFVPVSQLEKKGHNEWWTEQASVDMTAQFAGQEVGTLVTGSVRRIEPFGVFVGINNTRVSGLLHISNVSRQHIETVQGVFEVGEEVKCLVMGLDPGYTNISLSIAELELEEGDVLCNKQRVWEKAEEQAGLFRAHLDELREQGYDFDQQVDA